MRSWLVEEFGVEKPIIGMLHLAALPGDPEYDADGGVERILDRAGEELASLQEGGVDAVMFSNEFSLPYLTKTEPITAITMARIIGQLRESIRIPFGVNVLWDGAASIDLAVATGARFVREVFTGVYAGDFGLWDTSVGDAARHRRRVHGERVRMLYNVVPESAKYLAGRDLTEIAETTVFATRPDALCVSGSRAGAATDLAQLREIKSSAGATPVFANTGVTLDTLPAVLEIADGAVVGSHFKHDGCFAARVDPDRVKAFMALARATRRAPATSLIDSQDERQRPELSAKGQ